MLERFNEQQVELIKNCAEIVHSIEVGTVNQKNINALFETSYFFADSEYDWEENLRDVNYASRSLNRFHQE